MAFTDEMHIRLTQIATRDPDDEPNVGSIIYVPAAGGGWQELVISVPAANVRNALGIDNGETSPSWKTTLDATTPAAVDAAGSPGTSLIYSHRDHAHPQDPALTAIDFLVGTATGELSAEIVVGATPGGELGNTWASPTVDTTHSGSAHHAAVTVTDSTTIDLTLAAQDITAAINHTHKFRATRTTSQTLTDKSFTKIQFNTEAYDPGADYDNATNYNYTVPVTGYYLIVSNVSLVGGNPGTNQNSLIAIFVSGTNTVRGIRWPGYADVATGTLAHDVKAGAIFGLVVNAILYLTSGDTVDIRVYADNSGGNAAVVENSLNDFAMHLLSI